MVAVSKSNERRHDACKYQVMSDSGGKKLTSSLSMTSSTDNRSGSNADDGADGADGSANLSASLDSRLENASNEVQVAFEFWKEFDLESKRSTLDQQCVDMKELKAASMAGRKRLNEATKAFRAKPKDEQVVMILDVLKAYQEEIDQLSKRSKFSEAAFYGLYKAIYDAPDPTTLIDGLLNHVNSSSSYQLEIERLKSELLQVTEA